MSAGLPSPADLATAGGFSTKVVYYTASKVLVVGMKLQFLISIELLLHHGSRLPGKNDSRRRQAEL